jgi:hypothetical protein
MRKLAPMFITTSILALAAGSALADNTMGATDKNGNPSVSNNTQHQPLSYSDKSNTAKGTNAKMDDKSSVSTSSTGDKLSSDKVNSTTTFATDEDKRDAKPSSQAGDKADLTAKPAKAKKAKVAHHTSKVHKDTTVATDTNVTGTGTEKMEKNPPLSATKGEAANSITGKSAGQ